MGVIVGAADAACRTGSLPGPVYEVNVHGPHTTAECVQPGTLRVCVNIQRRLAPATTDAVILARGNKRFDYRFVCACNRGGAMCAHTQTIQQCTRPVWLQIDSAIVFCVKVSHVFGALTR